MTAMRGDELRQAEEDDRLDWLAAGAARALAGEGVRERYCQCLLPCPCNVPFEGRGILCPECRRGNHMDRNGERRERERIP